MTTDVAIDVVAAPVEPVNVLRRADEPAHFLWRGRLYAVRSVRAHWFEEHRSGGPSPVGPAPADAGEPAGSAGLRGRPDDGGVRAPHDRELWRVEAAAGRMAPTGVYDLCLAWPDGDWTLASVLEQDR